MNEGKVVLNVEITGMDKNLEKADKLVNLLKEAKSLSEELASIEFKFSVKK